MRPSSFRVSKPPTRDTTSCVSQTRPERHQRARVLTVNPRPAAVSGVWRFEQGNLTTSAGVGQLSYADGAATADLTTFETTDGASTPHIGGKPVKFMRVPAFTEAAHGYALTMPTTPNGGGGYLNRYTMVFDILIPGSVGWTPLFNASPVNANDADFYVSNVGALGIGDLGYSAAETIAQDTWYRVAFAADLGGGKVNYYVNGQLVHARTGGSILDGRFALYTGQDAGPQVLLFSEPTGSYTHELLLHSFMFTDRRLSADEIKALGGPQPDGIPLDSSGPVTLKVSLSGHNAYVHMDRHRRLLPTPENRKPHRSLVAGRGLHHHRHYGQRHPCSRSCLLSADHPVIGELPSAAPEKPPERRHGNRGGFRRGREGQRFR